MTLLEIKSLSKSFGGVHAVVDFSLEQGESEINAIIGPNGAGKTTVFNLISGLNEADAGEVVFMGSDITRAAAHNRYRLGISRTFQNIRLFNDLTILDNLKMACGHLGKYTFWEEALRLGRVQAEEQRIETLALETLEYLGLEGYAHMHPQSLAYGLRRRLELARALMAEPELLLLDEPAAGLNPAEVEELIGTIERLQAERDLSILLVEHHMEVVMQLCKTIHVMDFGKKIAAGSPEEIRKDPNVLQAYLGDEA
jgi:branched-chain amino acid transport system ATP-binding protein